MYAVVSTGGKQYRVEPGATLSVERLGAEAGASVTFDRVLLVGDEDSVTVGSPVVSGASVSATVLGDALGPKIIIFKFKQKVKYRRRTGHRQHLTRVRIDAINTAGSAKAKPAKSAEPEFAETLAEAAPAAPATKPKPRRAAKPKAAKAGPAELAESAQAEVAEPTAKAPTTTEADKPKPRRAAKPKAPKAEGEE